jgi:hypothetical protein
LKVNQTQKSQAVVSLTSGATAGAAAIVLFVRSAVPTVWLVELFLWLVNIFL